MARIEYFIQADKAKNRSHRIWSGNLIIFLVPALFLYNNAQNSRSVEQVNKRSVSVLRFAIPKWHTVEQNGTVQILASTESMNQHSSISEYTERPAQPEPFCVPWNISSDEWWTHHVEWEIFHEDDTHYCFRYIVDANKRTLFRSTYDLQYNSDCSAVLTRRMWSSGLGADIKNVLDALAEGRVWGRAVQIEGNPWHYASPKPLFDKETAVCSSQNMFCYFLPLSKCPPGEVMKTKPAEMHFGFIWNGNMAQPPGAWYWEYATRSQTWFRRRVYEVYKQQEQSYFRGPCTVIHVRRGDVINHNRFSRRYFPISDYVKAAHSRMEQNVLLLTDDHNAIGEALANFPDKTWMFINRTRYRANEGGWEQHLPSKDPAYEFSVIFAEFRMVQQCSGLVRSTSNFGDLLYLQMIAKNTTAWVEKVENINPKEEVFDAKNSQTQNVSKSYQ